MVLFLSEIFSAWPLRRDINYVQIRVLYHKACWGDYKGTKTVKRRVRSPEIIKSQNRENLTPQALTRNHRKLQLEISGTHNPEVAGSSPAPATIKTAAFDKKTAVFLTFWGHTLPTFLLKGRGESLGLFFLRLYSRGLCELSGTSGKMIVQKKKWVRFSKKFQARKGQKAETGSRKQLIHAAETARFILLKYV